MSKTALTHLLQELKLTEREYITRGGLPSDFHLGYFQIERLLESYLKAVMEEASKELPTGEQIDSKANEYSATRSSFYPFTDGDIESAFEKGSLYVRNEASLLLAKKESNNSFLTIELSRAKDSYKALDMDFENLRSELAKRDEELEKYNTLVHEMEKSMSIFQSELLTEKSEKEELKHELMVSKKNYEHIHNTCAGHYKKIEELESELSTLKSTNEGNKEIAIARGEAITALQDEIEALRKENEGESEDVFVNNLLSELQKLGYDTSNCDGDETPEFIIARWFHNKISEVVNKNKELRKKMDRMRNNNDTPLIGPGDLSP